MRILATLVMVGCAAACSADDLHASAEPEPDDAGSDAHADARTLPLDSGMEADVGRAPWAPWSPFIPCDEDLPIGPTDAPLQNCDLPPPWIPPEADTNQRLVIEDWHELALASCRQFNRDLARRWAEDPEAAQSYLDLLVILGCPAGQLSLLHGRWGSPSYLSRLACEDLGVSGDWTAMAFAWVERHRPLLGIADDDITLELRQVVENRASAMVTLDQRIAGLPVFRGSIALFVEPGGVRQIHSSLVPDQGVAQRLPDISAASAHVRAAAVQPALTTPTATVRLGVYDLGYGIRTYLAWSVTNGSAVAFVDASSGEILWSHDGWDR